MSNIPLGTQDDPRAPWNQEDEEFGEVAIKVTFTASKRIVIGGFKSEVEDFNYLKRAVLNFLTAKFCPKGLAVIEIEEIERLNQ